MVCGVAALETNVTATCSEELPNDIQLVEIRRQSGPKPFKYPHFGPPKTCHGFGHGLPLFTTHTI